MHTSPPARSADDSAPRAARDHALSVLGWPEMAHALAARCSSLSAARDAEALLPILDENAARLSLAETEEARRLQDDEGLPVAGVRDVARAIDLASRGGRLEPSDLADVARSADALARLHESLATRADMAPLLHDRATRIARLPDLVRAIDRAVDEHGRLRDDASQELQGLHRRKASLSRGVEARLDALRRDPDVAAALTDDYVTIRDDRHVLPVRSDRRARVPGILHGRSGSGHSLFIEPTELVELNNDLRAVGLDIEEECERILRELSARVARHAAELDASLAEHRAVDLAAARARLARDLGATTPETGRDVPLDLRDLAHPMLVLMRRAAAAGAGAPVVTNDVLLEPPALGIVVSGPNTGGKTVLLKAVGLACLMVRAGLPIACSAGSRVPFIDAILADIGDEQSIERSLSSFSGHVAVLRDILAACREVGGDAIVLLDEIMAGTDPAEGGPLAEAVLEELSRLGARVVVTTHLGSLKAFAAASDVFVNAGMEFDEQSLRPTFRVRLGLPGASAAIMVAERLGLPEDLVARAKELAGTQQISVERLLRDLDAARVAADRARDEARTARSEAERGRAEWEVRLAAMARKDEQFVRRERAAFESDLAGLREQARDITRRLQGQPGLAASADAIRRLDEVRERARDAGRRALTPSGPAPPRPAPAPGIVLGPGARVRSVSMDRAGTVIDPPDARGRVRVAFGGITMAVAASDLAAAAGGAQPRATSKARRSDPVEAPAANDVPSGGVPFTPQSPRNTCDLRGQRVDEALSALSSFLERAASSGERSVVIIHGHGTGALKLAVRGELRQEPRVSRLRPGGDGEGGDGVTVALLA